MYKYENGHDTYYLEGSLALLDNETEWHYDAALRQIHWLPKDGRDPNQIKVEARVRAPHSYESGNLLAV